MSLNKKTTMVKGRFTRYVEQNMGELARFMVYAVLEWVLIALLFIDGFFAFVANEFAKLFELRAPCCLCTKIDHIFVSRGRDFYYNDSICESHKKDVSYLAYCHNHKKLSDIRKMCKACLLSFATEKQSDLDTYKSLVGVFHKDLECFVEDDQHQIQLSVPAARTREDAGPIEKSRDNMTIGCSCCGVPLKFSSATGCAKGKNVNGIAPAPTPSPRAPLRRNDDNPGLDLPPIRYPELKFMSENESEIQEDEYESLPKNQKDETKAATLPLLPEGDELVDDSNRTPIYGKGNKFFGIPLTDSAQNSPRVAMRISKRSPLEKSEFVVESIDGTLPNDGECDSTLQGLKRQVRLDRKSLMALYMELDEERSASAIAANEAMAMITRLQADKAAVQMEALQYQRMMEEQAEYDQEALEATYDLLEKREEELRVLEAEIEAYREKYGLLKDFVYKDQDEAGECGTRHANNGEIKAQNDPPGTPREKAFLIGRFKKLDRVRNLSSNGMNPDGLNDDETGNGNKDALTRQLSLLTHLSDRVKVLEKHSEGTKLLAEINQNLQKLRHLVNQPNEEQNKSPPGEQKKELSKTLLGEQKREVRKTPLEERSKTPLEGEKKEQSQTPLEEQSKDLSKTPSEEQKKDQGETDSEEQKDQSKTPSEEQKDQSKTPSEELKEDQAKTPSEENKEQSKTPSEEPKEQSMAPSEEQKEQSKTTSEEPKEPSKTPSDEQKNEQDKTPSEQPKEQSKTPLEEQKKEHNTTPLEEQKEQNKTPSEEQNKTPPKETPSEEPVQKGTDFTSMVKGWF